LDFTASEYQTRRYVTLALSLYSWLTCVTLVVALCRAAAYGDESLAIE